MDSAKHKINLTNILIDIYKDGFLASRLGFKGGTAAMLFYHLPRFSVDLDFDYLDRPENISRVIAKISQIVSAKYTLKDQSLKYNTLFWLLSYGAGYRKIKVEVSTRDNPDNHYALKSFYGTTLKVLVPQDMIAHKMVALTERPNLANRDLFDLHYFLETRYAAEINYQIIRRRTGKKPPEFYRQLLSILETINQNRVLEGLGEVLTESQKDWAKAKLLPELKQQIKRQIAFIV